MSDHLQMSYRRQHVLLSYFKTLSVGPIWSLNSRPPAQQFGAPQHELTKRGLKYIGLQDYKTKTKPCYHAEREASSGRMPF